MTQQFTSKSCLVTGYGFVSSHLVGYLLDQGASVTVIEKNLPASSIPPKEVEIVKADLRYLKHGMEFDYVFHLAGITNAAYAEANPMETYEANVLATCNLLDKVRVKERFVFTSSAVVYGNATENTPLSENRPPTPISVYGATKLATEELIKVFSRTRNLSFNIVRFFNLYGPNQTAFYIVPQIIIQVLRDKKVILRNAKVERDFLFVNDAVECVGIIALKGENNKIVNIGSGIAVSLGELANTILDVMNEHGITVESGSELESFSASRLIADIERARRAGWNQKTPLRDGLLKTFPSYQRAIEAERILSQPHV